MSYRYAKLMQPPPTGEILVICVAFPSVTIHSLIGSSLKDATEKENNTIKSNSNFFHDF